MSKPSTMPYKAFYTPLSWGRSLTIRSVPWRRLSVATNGVAVPDSRCAGVLGWRQGPLMLPHRTRTTGAVTHYGRCARPLPDR